MIGVGAAVLDTSVVPARVLNPTNRDSVVVISNLITSL
jgi:hypothetical protein